MSENNNSGQNSQIPSHVGKHSRVTVCSCSTKQGSIGGEEFKKLSNEDGLLQIPQELSRVCNQCGRPHVENISTR